ncbi:MAG: hypothetical protein ACOCQD_02365 [archaeon]
MNDNDILLEKRYRTLRQAYRRAKTKLARSMAPKSTRGYTERYKQVRNVMKSPKMRYYIHKSDDPKAKEKEIRDLIRMKRRGDKYALHTIQKAHGDLAKLGVAYAGTYAASHYLYLKQLYWECRKIKDPIKKTKCKIRAIDKVITQLNREKNKLEEPRQKRVNDAIKSLEERKSKLKQKLNKLK